MKVFFGLVALAPGVSYDGESGAQEFGGELQQEMQTRMPVRSSSQSHIPRGNWGGTVTFTADVVHLSSAEAQTYVRKHLIDLRASSTDGQTLKVVGEGTVESAIYYASVALQSVRYRTIGLRSIWFYTFAHGDITAGP